MLLNVSNYTCLGIYVSYAGAWDAHIKILYKMVRRLVTYIVSLATITLSTHHMLVTLAALS